MKLDRDWIPKKLFGQKGANEERPALIMVIAPILGLILWAIIIYLLV